MTEHILLAITAFLFKDGLVVGMVKLYLAAFWHAQIVLGFGTPPDYKPAQAGLHHGGLP